MFCCQLTPGCLGASCPVTRLSLESAQTSEGPGEEKDGSKVRAARLAAQVQEEARPPGRVLWQWVSHSGSVVA